MTSAGKEFKSVADGAGDVNSVAGPTAESRRPPDLKLRGDVLVAKVKDLLHQGNVRRIVVKNDEGHTVLEIPVTAGVIAAVAAPIVTAIGGIAALAYDWTVEVEHREDGSTTVTSAGVGSTDDETSKSAGTRGD